MRLSSWLSAVRFPTRRNNSRQFNAFIAVGAGYDAGMRGCVLCRSQLLTPVVHATKSWRTAINRNQNLLGKLIVVLDRHEEVITALTQDEWAELHREVRWATERLRQAFAPDHFNYVFLQNQDRHVHLHVIPRYAGPRRFAGLDFSDPDWPGHYQPGVANVVAGDALDAIASALVGTAAGSGLITSP